MRVLIFMMTCLTGGEYWILRSAEPHVTHLTTVRPLAQDAHEAIFESSPHGAPDQLAPADWARDPKGILLVSVLIPVGCGRRCQIRMAHYLI